MESFSCCMNSLPYTLLSCQMLSNRSKGFLQPSSASLFKDQKTIRVQLKNISCFKGASSEAAAASVAIFAHLERIFPYCLRQIVQNPLVAHFLLLLETKIA